MIDIRNLSRKNKILITLAFALIVVVAVVLYEAKKEEIKTGQNIPATAAEGKKSLAPNESTTAPAGSGKPVSKEVLQSLTAPAKSANVPKTTVKPSKK